MHRLPMQAESIRAVHGFPARRRARRRTAAVFVVTSTSSSQRSSKSRSERNPARRRPAACLISMTAGGVGSNEACQPVRANALCAGQVELPELERRY